MFVVELVACPRLIMAVLLLRDTCAPAHISTFLCKLPSCLLRKWLHCTPQMSCQLRRGAFIPIFWKGVRLPSARGVFRIFV